MAFAPAIGHRGAKPIEPDGNGRPFDTTRAGLDRDPFAGAQRHMAEITLGAGNSGSLGVRALLMELSGDPEITRPYLQHPWVYACIDARMRALASMPLVLRRFEAGSPDPAEIRNGALPALLRRPNPLMSMRKLVSMLAVYDLLWGETFLVLLRDRTDETGRTTVAPITGISGQRGMGATIPIPTEVWPVPGHLVQEIHEKGSALPTAWKIYSDNGSTTYPAESVVQISHPNPHNPLRGVGPTTPLLRAISQDYTADRFNDALLKNGGMPSGVLTSEQILTDSTAAQLKERWREQHERPDSHQRTAVLGAGLKYQPLGRSPKDLEFKEMRLANRDRILAVYGVTKTVLALTDDVNRANSREALRSFWENTVLPHADFLADELTTRFVSRLAPYMPKRGVRYELTFDASKVSALREDADAKIERTLKLIEKGQRSFAEAAAIAGLDIDEANLQGSDERWVSTSMRSTDESASDTGNTDSSTSNDTGPSDDASSSNAVEPSDDMRQISVLPIPVERARAEHASMDRAEYWSLHDAFLAKREDTFAKKAGGVLRRFILSVRGRIREIARSFEADPVESRMPVMRHFVASEPEIERILQLNLERWGEEMFGSIAATYGITIDDAAKALRAELGLTDPDPTTLVTRTHPDALQFLAEKKVEIVEGWMSTLARDIQREFVTILAAGAAADVGSLARAIAETLPDLEASLQSQIDGVGVRAMRIARTEVNSAASFARFKQMQTDGVTRHTWISSRDNAVRESHIELDGRTVAVGEVFGFGLRRPLDPEGAPEQVINCRCVVVPAELDDDEN